MQKTIIDWQNSPDVVELTEDTEVLGLFVGHEADLVKRKLVFTHRNPNLNTRISIKAVVFDESKFDLEAMVRIPDGAGNTDTYLKIDCLIMSDKAQARAVPSLEIQEDEVKGGHGATVGMVDQSQLHYIMSRGFPREAAETMLVEAFIGEMQMAIDAVDA